MNSNTLDSTRTISEDSFIKWSLVSLRQKLCDRNTSISKADIANYVSRFLVAYIDPTTVDEELSLEDINKVFHDVMRVLSCSWVERFNLIWEIEESLVDTCNKSAYAITMLCDIAQTAWLVEEIISQQIPKNEPTETYFWLDLGTWSGILLDAQDICSQRNNFASSTNFWVDHCAHHVERAWQLALRLSKATIIKGDITRPDVFENLPNTPVHQVSLELIGQPWVNVCLPEDPFHLAVKQLFHWLGSSISNRTRFFPAEFHMDATYFWDRLLSIVGTPWNLFHSDVVLALEDKREGVEKSSDASEIISPCEQEVDFVLECWKINIGWNVVPLENIWEEYILDGIVIQNLEWRPRRWVNQKESIIRELASGELNFKVWIIDLIITMVYSNSLEITKYFTNSNLISLLTSFKKKELTLEDRERIINIILSTPNFLDDFILFIRRVPLHLLK